jgi:hypothetical protein
MKKLLILIAALSLPINFAHAQQAKISSVAPTSLQLSFASITAQGASVAVSQLLTGTDEALNVAYEAQKFVATAQDIAPVCLRVKTSGSHTGDSYIQVSIYSDDTGAPDASVTTTDSGYPQKIYATELSTSFGEVCVSARPASALTEDASYWIVVFTSAVGGGSFVVDSSNAAATAQYATSSDGSTWTPANTKRMYFRILTRTTSTTITSASGYTLHGTSSYETAGFFESTSGIGVKGNSVWNFGVGGFSTHLPGVRGTSTYSFGVEGASAATGVAAIKGSGPILTTHVFQVSPSTVLTPDDAAGTSPSEILAATVGKVWYACLDSDGCTVSISETNALDGSEITIKNIGANAATIPEVPGQMEMAGDFVTGAMDSITFDYTIDRWIERCRSNN